MTYDNDTSCNDIYSLTALGSYNSSTRAITVTASLGRNSLTNWTMFVNAQSGVTGGSISQSGGVSSSSMNRVFTGFIGDVGAITFTLHVTADVTNPGCGVGGDLGRIEGNLVFSLPPTVNISASPTSILYNSASTLTWSSTNTTSCTASNGWSGSKITSGTQSTGPLTASRTYVLTCTGPGGSANDNAIVSVSVPFPDLTASTPSQTAATINVAQNYTSTITNNGTATTDAGFANIFQTSPVSDGTSGVVDYLVTPNTSTIDVGASAGISKSITFTSVGTMYIRACADKSSVADVNGVISESNEGNNCSMSTPWTAVTITAPVMFGTLTPASSSCVVASGASSCNINFTWSTTNPVATSAVTSSTTNTGVTAPNTSVANGNSGGPTAFAVPYINGGSHADRAFFLYNNGVLLDNKTVSADCVSGTSWDGSKCAINTVPTVTSPTATSITTTSAILGANVVSLGIPASISARGTCYGTSPNPMTNCLAQGGTTTGVYSHSRTSLTPNTTYYYRGYAINATGTGYSADGTFTATNTNDSCGTYSGATPRLTEPTTNPSACNPGIYANSPADITINGSQAWRWSCGTVTSCTAPKYGCTTATDTNYDPTGPNNTYGCANTCANGQTNYPTCTTGGFTVGQCSADHYNCVAGTSINSSNNPSRWTWTCLGSDNITNTDDVSCAEPHPPGYEEPQ